VKQDAGFNSWRQQLFCHLLLLLQEWVCVVGRVGYMAQCVYNQALAAGWASACAGVQWWALVRRALSLVATWFLYRGMCTNCSPGWHVWYCSVTGSVPSVIPWTRRCSGFGRMLQTLRQVDPVCLPCGLLGWQGIYSYREESFQFLE
jgi:hypothetical protein